MHFEHYKKILSFVKVCDVPEEWVWNPTSLWSVNPESEAATWNLVASQHIEKLNWRNFTLSRTVIIWKNDYRGDDRKENDITLKKWVSFKIWEFDDNSWDSISHLCTVTDTQTFQQVVLHWFELDNLYRNYSLEWTEIDDNRRWFKSKVQELLWATPKINYI